MLEFATPRAGPIDVFRDYTTDKELGLGVIDVKNNTVERPEAIIGKVKTALKYFDASQVFLNPDCGFASGRDWPVLTRELAFRKLEAMTAAAEVLQHEHGR